MGEPWWVAVLAAAVPFAVLAGGVVAIRRLGGGEPEKRDDADAQVARPLHTRLRYDKDAAEAHWGALTDKGLELERRQLRLDLAFPPIYAAAIAWGLFTASRAASFDLPAAWILALAITLVAADWTENAVLLAESRKYRAKEPLGAGWIRLASTASTAKVVLLLASLAALVWLVSIALRS